MVASTPMGNTVIFTIVVVKMRVLEYDGPFQPSRGNGHSIYQYCVKDVLLYGFRRKCVSYQFAVECLFVFTDGDQEREGNGCVAQRDSFPSGLVSLQIG